MYIADKLLLEKKISFRFFLLNIYGVGSSRRSIILKNYGILGCVRMNVIRSLIYKKIVRFLDENYVTERSLGRIISSNLKREFKIQSLRGWRLSNGLPINGQTSRPNGSTSKKLKLDYHIHTRKERKLVLKNALLHGPNRRKNLRKAFKRLRKKSTSRRSKRRFKLKGRFV